MKIKATEDQVKQMCVNAIMASTPMGLGFLHFDPKEKIEAKDLELNYDGSIDVDYYNGRMVKLYVRKLDEENQWQTHDTARDDYQSWIRKYPTYKDLALSVPGIEIL